jgi:hypothetical protein
MSKPTTEDQILEQCPTCRVKGVEVYRAEAHPVNCVWMQTNMHRCDEHDELLRPDEERCPDPFAPEASPDPHSRRSVIGLLTGDFNARQAP